MGPAAPHPPLSQPDHPCFAKSKPLPMSGTGPTAPPAHGRHGATKLAAPVDGRRPASAPHAALFLRPASSMPHAAPSGADAAPARTALSAPISTAAAPFPERPSDEPAVRARHSIGPAAARAGPATGPSAPAATNPKHHPAARRQAKHPAQQALPRPPVHARAGDGAAD